MAGKENEPQGVEENQVWAGDSPGSWERVQSGWANFKAQLDQETALASGGGRAEGASFLSNDAFHFI